MSAHSETIRSTNPSTVRTAAVAVVSTLAVVVVVVIALAATHTFTHSSPPAASSATEGAATAPPATTPSGGHATPVKPTPPSPPVQPSAATKTLQEQLGRLNYYEGPVDGIMGTQTVQAIQYLQRDAGLPQTGQMNAATEAALQNFLAHGNNQMAG